MPDPAAAAAYLDAARTSRRLGSTWLPKAAAVAGGSPQALGFAVALAQAGVAVTLIEDDQHDAQRVRDTLARTKDAPGIAVAVGTQHQTTVALLVEASGANFEQRLQMLADHRPMLAPGGLALSLGHDVMQTRRAFEGPRIGPLILIDTAAPPPQIGLIEILETPTAPPTQLARAEGLARALGAVPLRTPTFLAAPLIARLEDCAEHLIYHGATPWEVDAALEAFGFDLGPCAAQDLRGLDLTTARHRAEDALGTRHVPTPVLDRMVTEGRLGRKGSVGWYRYPGGGGRVIDPLIEDLAREEAHFAGVTPQPIADSALRQRLLAALIAEATRLLASGVPAAMIDLVATQATGFPAALGGPLFYASHIKIAREKRTTP
ncbi:3-hydroxyacyl-CoA dehydrogenase family protein [Pararhodobacter sp.]|uniref:3-hydroxyacyl-CoA dehydrogenase family protein n=1 Tax=Pararhodobacter sp. TaxID=2127056 RepID=UPI002AFF5218|nr:3-hydroxyacyl-CoA dehydrogenase family protein [Pararhodobacter sp.]